jgi:chromosome segregation ATPase
VAVETEVTAMCETTDVTTMGDGAEVKTLKIRDCSDGTCQNAYLIEELQEQLAAAKARIAELEAQVSHYDKCEAVTQGARVLSIMAQKDARIAELEAQIAAVRDSRDDMEEQYFGALIDGTVQP